LVAIIERKTSVDVFSHVAASVGVGVGVAGGVAVTVAFDVGIALAEGVP
jgi:hypothetical protein